MTRDDLIALFEAAISAADQIERKGKANPYTSANGHMFSQINKDDQLGVRFGIAAGWQEIVRTRP